MTPLLTCLWHCTPVCQLYNLSKADFEGKWILDFVSPCLVLPNRQDRVTGQPCESRGQQWSQPRAALCFPPVKPVSAKEHAHRRLGLIPGLQPPTPSAQVSQLHASAPPSTAWQVGLPLCSMRTSVANRFRCQSALLAFRLLRQCSLFRATSWHLASKWSITPFRLIYHVRVLTHCCKGVILQISTNGSMHASHTRNAVFEKLGLLLDYG